MERSEGKWSVLVAHADPSVRSALLAALAGREIDGIEAPGGGAAISAFREIRPDAILLDASLPESDGIAVCAAIRDLAEGEDAVILVATEVTDIASIERALDAGADDVVALPLQAPVVRRRLLRLLEARRSLRESATQGEHYARLFETSTDALILGAVHQREAGDATDFVILDVNPAFEQMMGVRREDVRGRSAFENAPRWAQEQIAPAIQVVFTGKSSRFEFSIPPDDRHCVATLHYVGPGVFMSIIEDVTEQHRLQEEASWTARVDAALADLGATLLSSRSMEHISGVVLQRARALTGSRFGFVGYIDAETSALVASTSITDVWDSDQVSGKRTVFQHRDGLWGWVIDHGEAVLANDIPGDPRSASTPAGHMPVERFLGVPALADGKVLGMIALANAETPYTDRHLAATRRLADLYAMALQRLDMENALRASESLSLSVIENSGDGIVVTDEQGLVVTWNRAQAMLTGTPPEQAMGRHILELQAEVAWPRAPAKEHAERYEEQIREFVRTGRAQWLDHAIDREIITADGTHKVMQSIVFAIPGRRGFLSGSISRDVTLERRRESEFRRLQRLESLGILAGGIAHEFNNVLTALMLHLQLADRAIEPEGPARSHMEKSIQSAHRAAQLTQQLLAYSGKAYLIQAPFDVNEIVREQLELIEPAARNRVRLALAADAGQALGDRRMIASGIQTLLANALRATGETGGSVHVSTARYPRGPERGGPLLHVGATPVEGPYVCVRVVDAGAGMDSETLAHCFEPYYSGHDSASDLEMSTLMGIASAHGGGLQASSQIGRGSNFAMWLPAAPAIGPGR